jgi:NADH:ubiquinone oxidoreductase subunit 5 (subunit L)/multisubunit Na+/H+ antiporter MnhA subunit
MSHVSIIFNVNVIVIMILFVVSSIFTFVVYYMGNDVSSEGFKLLKVLFLGLMVLILVTYGVIMFIGWEGIGVISICLIGYWIRPIAKSGAISAMMYNR